MKPVDFGLFVIILIIFFLGTREQQMIKFLSDISNWILLNAEQIHESISKILWLNPGAYIFVPLALATKFWVNEWAIEEGDKLWAMEVTHIKISLKTARVDLLSFECLQTRISRNYFHFTFS